MPEQCSELGLIPPVRSITSALIPWNTCGVFITAPHRRGARVAAARGLCSRILAALVGLTLKDLDNKPYKKSKAAAKAE